MLSFVQVDKSLGGGNCHAFYFVCIAYSVVYVMLSYTKYSLE
jgi:hypothetical protein